ncbi:MAG: GH3 auxin-responsive promoter family protein [Planctomycetaceae bacterium]|nr:GH3 auxin-responsive promoter family protein [Planctomycetaceae bacterium]
MPRSVARRLADRYLGEAGNCRSMQLATLDRLLALNAQSRFSRSSGLARATNVREFRDAVPVADFEFYRPHIEELKQGQFDALLGPENPLLMFSLSSGTTAGAKYIPITQQFFEDYRRGWQIWGIRSLDAHPGINSRRILQMTSRHDRYVTPAGIPCGNISGLVVAMQHPLVRSMYVVPGDVAQIEDPDIRNYVTLRLAMADPSVGMITTANPSTLVQLARQGDSLAPSLIRDIADGTLAVADRIEPGLRKLLLKRITRRPARARQLEQLREQKGHLWPQDYWPGCQLIAVWTGGSAAAYLPALRKYYGEPAIRDHGLSASEGRMTIPLSDGSPAGLLDVGSHFFEFIPEEEYDFAHPAVLMADELEVGRNYYILLTTASGLYRYDICDVVRCTGHCGTTPELEFLNKGAHISNLTGEKISESQVVQAVSQAVESLKIEIDQFTLCPFWGDPPGYELIVESPVAGVPAVAQRMAAEVDHCLQAINCEYRDKRKTGRLNEIRCRKVPDGTWQKFARRKQQELGGSQEQYKHPCLVPDLSFGPELLKRCAGLSPLQTEPQTPLENGVPLPRNSNVA